MFLAYIFSAFFTVFSSFQVEAYSSSQTVYSPHVYLQQGPVPSKCQIGQTINTPVRIAYANDGDTIGIYTNSGELFKVRVVGTDSPESYYMGMNQGVWADHAKHALQTLLPEGTIVKLQFDPLDTCDRNGRFLAHVFLMNGFHINKAMVANGLAVSYCVAPSTVYCLEFGELTNRAINQRLGFFQDPTVMIPYEWRQYVGNSTFVYYIGDMKTKLVYSSNNIKHVPVGNRIIYYNPRYIVSPYRLAPGQIPIQVWNPPQRSQ